MRTYCIANFKGGVGKTTAAVNLADIFAAGGERVLLIDADPQHNATTFFGCEGQSPTLTDVLRGEAEPLWSDVLLQVRTDRLWLLPADLELLTLDLAAMRGEGSVLVRRLRDFLAVIEEDGAMDRVIIDCPPSFTAASVAALIAAGTVILPTAADAFSVAGVEEMLSQIRTLHARPCRVLITMADRTRLFSDAERLLRQLFDCYDTVIRRCVKAPESTYAREPLRSYAPHSTAAEDYAALAAEIRREETVGRFWDGFEKPASAGPAGRFAEKEGTENG